jgi:hypothetical protein
MPPSATQLRAIETTPNSGFDVRLDGRTLFTSTAKTAYTPVSAGTHTLEITAPGTSAALNSLPASFAANSSQSVIVAGATEDQSLIAFVVPEDTSAPAAGMVKLRFVHGAHALGPVDIFITDAGTLFPQTPTFASLPYKSWTDVFVRPAQNFSLCWTPAGVRNPFTGGPNCSVVDNIVAGGKATTNMTFVLPDAPTVVNAPPGLGTFIMFRLYPN